MAPFPAVSQVCITRPTADLAAQLRFYRDALGLTVLFSFEGEGGAAGAMVGLPGNACHLELLQVTGATPQPPDRLNLLVLHLGSAEAVAALSDRLKAAGLAPVAPANPYWIDKAVVFDDPDGWPIALSTGAGLAA